MPRLPLSDDQIEHTRARILAEAACIVRQDGYAKLSMRTLASAVGLTAGALYRYFPGKHQVLVDYCAEALDELYQQMRDVSAREENLLLRIEQLLIAYGRFALADRDRFRILFLDEEVGQLEISDPRILAAYDLVQQQIADAQKQGLLGPLPLDTATRILWGAVHGVVALATTVSEIDFSDADNLVLTAARNALRGLATQPDRF